MSGSAGKGQHDRDTDVRMKKHTEERQHGRSVQVEV